MGGGQQAPGDDSSRGGSEPPHLTGPPHSAWLVFSPSGPPDTAARRESDSEDILGVLAGRTPCF